MKNKLPALLLLFAVFASCKKSEVVSSAGINISKTFNRDITAPFCSGDSTKEGTRYITGDNAIVAGSVTIDVEGDIYTTGHFTGVYDFNPGSTTIPLPDNAGIFLDKLNPDGNFAWVIQLYSYDTGGYNIGPDAPGKNGFYSLPTIIPDKSGNFYVLYTITQITKHNAGYTTIHLSKYSGAGSLLWSVQQYTGLGYVPVAAHLVGAGGISICSNYNAKPNPIDFGLGTPRHIVKDSGAFVQKINANGKFVSLTQVNASFEHIALDDDGNIFDTGTNISNGFGYVRKFDADGSSLWYIQLPTHHANSIITDANGDAILWSTLSTEMGEYDGDGNLKWHIVNLMSPQVVATDAGGDTYVAGNFTGTADFDPGTGVYNLSSPGITSLYVQKFDAVGNFIWAKKRQFPANEAAASITADPASYIYVVGAYKPAAGNNPVSYQNMYGTKISQCQ